MAEQGLAAKSRRNVFAAFHSFMVWLEGRRPRVGDPA